MKPILFNTDMVRAILEGSKTVTRRAVKGYALDHLELDTDGSIIGVYNQDEGRVFPIMDYAPYRPGDILYVRETWTRLWYVDPDGYTHYDQPMYYYAADGTPDITLYDEDGFEQDDQRIRWHPSIHMPREAARIFLRVTDVRVERLQDISEEQSRAEGAIDSRHYIHSPHNEYDALHSAREHFAEIWDSTIKPAGLSLYGWKANPWVWVIGFERCEKPETVAHE